MKNKNILIIEVNVLFKIQYYKKNKLIKLLLYEFKLVVKK